MPMTIQASVDHIPDAFEGLTADDLLALSDTERVALASMDDASDVVRSAAADLLNPQPEPDPVDPDMEAVLLSQQPVAQPQAEPPTTPPTANTDAAPGAEPPPQVQIPPAPQVDLAKLQADLAAAEAGRKAIVARFNDLEDGMDDDKLIAELDASKDTVTALRAQLTTAQQQQAAHDAALAAHAATLAQQQQAADDAWFDMVGKTMQRYGITAEEHVLGFDKVLRASEEQLRGAVPDAEIIEAALQAYAPVAAKKGLTIAIQPPANQPTPPQQGQQPQLQPRPQPQLPPVLAGVPGSSGAAVDTSAYGAIQQMINSDDVYAQEAAMERLGAEWDRYAKAFG